MEKKFARSAAAAGALLIGGAMLPLGPAAAQEPWSFSANLGVASNYMWRGQTQTGDQPAVSGGLDVGHESGFYAGTWVSNVDFGEGGPSYELDLYTGFGGAINDDFSYDLSVLYIGYPDGRDSDFAELGASGTFKWVTLGLAYTFYGENDGGLYDDGDIYYYASADFPLAYDFGFSVRGGYYDFRNDDVEVGVDDAGFAITESADYWNYGASISRDVGDFGTFAFNWDQNSGKQSVGYDPDPKFWVSWSKEF
jgi:uncharacterized protein (TIGR02001 family)